MYIEQPEGFTVHGYDSHVCHLKKSLYGLKKAPRAWYSRINNYLQRLGFTKSEADSNLTSRLLEIFHLLCYYMLMTCS